jgi:hypothetical protein
MWPEPEEGDVNLRRIPTIPQDWDEARDIPFFRVTTGLFSSAFCFGASVLLASNDDDVSEASISTVERRAADASRAIVDVPELHRS